MQVCSNGIGNQTLFDMSALEGPQSIANAQTSPNGAPAWYARAPTRPDVHYFYPRGAPITQIIVLKASNPWGDSFGTIPAVLFGYIRDDGELDFAVCGNAVYANAFLRPATAPAPPTPVSLKSSHTSGLSEGDHFTSLSSFEGKCGVRGQGFSSYLGGDPNTSTKFPIKALKKPCFTKWGEYCWGCALCCAVRALDEPFASRRSGATALCVLLGSNAGLCRCSTAAVMCRRLPAPAS
jgi:hypothetical protein